MVRGRLAVRLNQDVLAGIVILAFGLFFTVGAFWHSIGTLEEMGPGYFPLAAGVVLIVLGTGLTVTGFLPSTNAGTVIELRPISVLVAGLCIYALLMPYAGLFVGILLLVAICSLATPQSRPLETLVAGLALGAFSVLLFVKGLGIPLPLLPTMLPR